MTEFITVATFNFAYEITVLKSVLDNREIEYFFQNEMLTNSTTAVRLRGYAVEFYVEVRFFEIPDPGTK